ncbi:PAS domain S-box protein [candidate division KSB1 bacterium]|nr:PAS domain S-box protein [candidate division KSB1 bacterium]
MDSNPATKILVVEDENIVAKDIQNTLKALGYTVTAVVASGEEAIQKAGETQPDLVLMDIMLKGYQDGVEAARQIFARFNIPVVYLTAYTDETTLQRAKVTEPYGYILKPFEERELHIAIEMAIYKHKMAKKLKEREQWLATILRSITDAVIVTDDKSLVTFMNPVAEMLTGRKQKDTLGKNLAEVFKVISAENRSAAQPASRNGVAANFSLLVASDGREIPIDDSAAPIRDENGNLTGAVLVFRDISARQQAEAELHRRFLQIQHSEERYRALYDDNPAMYFTIDVGGKILSVNQFGADQLGYKVEELVGQSVLNVFYEEDKSTAQQNLTAWLQNPEQIAPCELRKVRKDGAIVWVKELARVVRDSAGRPVVLIVCEDITKSKQMEEALLQREEQLRQAHKMEAIGRLAGGVAHDFNNMLTAIIGTAEMSMLELHRDHPLRKDLKEIKQTADRAANLARQLLTFARRQIIAPSLLNLNDVLLNLDKLLHRLAGDNVDLAISTAPDLGFIKVDSGQIEQMIINLASNARDAMPNGGKLKIETANVTLDEAHARQHPEITSGEYVMLTVRDAGAGMAEEIKKHLFEPFFSAKDTGKGTGLGLATAYGIVQQNHGHIAVDSAPGQGTAFRIYFPRLADTGMAPKYDQSHVPSPGTETVLLVEDEPSVREVAARLLRERGYHVLVAANGDEALQLAKAHAKDKIHILIIDVVMPRLSGKMVADQIKALQPDMKVLFISGYADDTIMQPREGDASLAFLQKPFSPALLAHKIREMLDK